MPTERWRVFLDTAEEILPVGSRQVLVEADRVFPTKFPHLIGRYRQFIKNLAPLLVEDPKPAVIHEAKKVIDLEDAPITFCLPR